MSFENFRKKILNNTIRHHKIVNSYGVYDGFKHYRKIKPKDKKYVLTDCTYFKITRLINQLLAEKLLSGEEIILPHGMGILEIRKIDNTVRIKDGKLYTPFPIDWDKTLRLWYEDEECKENKTLVRIEEKETFRLLYNKTMSSYKYKSFYVFDFNKDLKKELKDKIKLGFDTFKITSYGKWI